MASIMNMPSIAYPCFMPASKVKREPIHESGVSSSIPSGDGDQFDFDLLAEYLLDEVTASDLTQFDFR